MGQFPTSSSYSFKHGNWFVFQDGDDWVRLWVSNKNGREKLYFNDRLITAAKNLTKIKVKHEFEENGNLYLIDLRMKFSISEMKTTCTLQKNETSIGQVEGQMNKKFKKIFQWLFLPLCILAGIIIGMSISSVLAIHWIILPFLVGVIGVILLVKSDIPYMDMLDTTDFVD